MRILRELAGLSPAWTLTGGAALIGFYLGQRLTRDLDLFWRRRAQLDHTPQEVRQRLASAGPEVAAVQSGVTFHRLRVTDGADACIVDLVAEPAAPLAQPQLVQADQAVIEESKSPARPAAGRGPRRCRR